MTLHSTKQVSIVLIFKTMIITAMLTDDLLKLPKKYAMPFCQRVLMLNEYTQLITVLRLYTGIGAYTLSVNQSQMN